MTRRQQVLGSLSSYADIVISLRSRYRSLHEAYSNSRYPTFATFRYHCFGNPVLGREVGGCGLVDGETGRRGRVELYRERGLVVLLAA